MKTLLNKALNGILILIIDVVRCPTKLAANMYIYCDFIKNLRQVDESTFLLAHQETKSLFFLKV